MVAQKEKRKLAAPQRATPNPRNQARFLEQLSILCAQLRLLHQRAERSMPVCVESLARTERLALDITREMAEVP